MNGDNQLLYMSNVTLYGLFKLEDFVCGNILFEVSLIQRYSKGE